MKANDIMTSPVITVQPETPVQEVARVLVEHRISGVPVLTEGRLVGLVSESDLLHRHELETERSVAKWPSWRQLFEGDRAANDYVKSHARRARDVMTREVVTVATECPVSEVVSLLEARGIRRVPVLRAGRLVGIISRANLVRALAARRPFVITGCSDDQTIRARLIAELERQPWWQRAPSDVTVTDGVVHYWGMFGAEEEIDAARIAAENVPGTRRVEDHRIAFRDIPSTL